MISFFKSIVLKFLLLITVLSTIAWIPASRVPVDPAEQKLFYLRQGRIYTEADYTSKKLARGKILGLSFSAPEKVWKAFINGNRWKKRGIAKGFVESRIITPQQAEDIKRLDLQKCRAPFQ